MRQDRLGHPHDAVDVDVEDVLRPGDGELLGGAGSDLRTAISRPPARATEHLRLIGGELQLADVRQQVTLSLVTEFENYSVFRPSEHSLTALDTIIDQIVVWSTALAPLRSADTAARPSLLHTITPVA